MCSTVHPADTVEMVNIRDEIHQLNQQIEVMGYNRWQFQELHIQRQELKQLAQVESGAKWTEVRKLRGNEQEEDRGIKDEDTELD